MKKYILATALSFISSVPAFAGNGLTPIIVFRNGSSTGTEILWTKSSNIHSPDICYDFIEVNGDRVPSHYIDLGNGYEHSPPAPPEPPAVVPNPSLAANLILADPIISLSAKDELMKYKSLLDSYPSDPAGVQQAWLIIVANNSGTWLTPVVQAAVEANCTAAHMPLR